ncbi:MAG: DUF4249 family protein [Bacteroidales bacterium]|nr:DUF4249 family protein [Bacteroidales bacterium]
MITTKHMNRGNNQNMQQQQKTEQKTNFPARIHSSFRRVRESAGGRKRLLLAPDGVPVKQASRRDEFIPKINEYENNLAVDGMIMDEAGGITIKISRTAEVNKPGAHHPPSDCLVTINDDEGGSVQIHEAETGVYTIDAQDYQATPGRSYQLSVVTPGGAKYESRIYRAETPGLP